MNKDFNIIRKKIDAFRRKYYSYKALQGLMIFVFTGLTVILIIALLENSLYMSSELRKIVLYSMVFFFMMIFIYLIIIPLFQISRIFRFKSDNGIVRLIPQHFGEIKDKLINVLELSNMNNETYSFSLVDAALTQKSRELKMFDFKEAITVENLRRIGYLLILSFGTALIVFIVDKSFITEPAKRIVNFNQSFVKPAPYQFIILNKELKVKKGSDYKVKVACRGNELPSVVYINIEGNDFIMKSLENGEFEYDVVSVTNQLHFYFNDLKYKSEVFLLNTIAVPGIHKFTIEIKPPHYTNLRETIIENVGDIKVPAGSGVKWTFHCFDTDSLKIKINRNAEIMAGRKENNILEVYGNFLKTTNYEILIQNRDTRFKSLMNSEIAVTEDLFPQIRADQIIDSVKLTHIFFTGNIKDDYGFTLLKFHISGEKLDTAIQLPVNPSLRDQDFYFSTDLYEFKNIGNTLSYYFSVTDNDGVNKPKTTISDSYIFTFPDEKDILEKQKEDYNNIEDLLKKGIKVTEELKKEIKDLQLKNINNSVSEWEKSQSVNDILSRKNYLEELLEQIENMNRMKNDYQNSFQEQSQEILKKQEEIEKLLEDVMTDELKKLLEEFSKLAEEFNSKTFNEMKEKMDLSFEDLSQQLDRNLEMLKKMKLEERIDKLIKQIENVQESEAILTKELEKNSDNTQQIERINKDSEDIRNAGKEANDIGKENELLKKPLIFDDFDEDFRDIDSEMQKTKEEIDKKNKKKGIESINRTVDKLQNLAFNMKQLLASNQSRQKGENILMLKRLLKNLIFVSVNQEKISSQTKIAELNDPVIRNLRREQTVLMEQSEGIKDSLYALANRTPQIGNVINQEILNMQINLMEAIKAMETNSYPQATVNQRFVMTATNNIALFLSDILRQMEEMPENGAPGDENCENGGGSKMGGLKKSAESLKQQLEQLIDQMKNGDGKNMGKQLSESLMQHEMMQKMLRDLINSGAIGNDSRKQLQQIDQILEQNRKEIMNRKVSQTLINRNNEIMVRLLEAEKSENERDLDNQRESNTADEKFYSKPAGFIEGQENRNVTLEYLQRKSLKLNIFYRGKQRSYMEKWNERGTQ